MGAKSYIAYPRKKEFVIQDRPSNCGPAALFNALINLDIRPNIYILESLCQCDPHLGVTKAAMTRALKSLRFGKRRIKFVEKRYPKIGDLERWLDKKCGIIYLYSWQPKRPNEGHFVFIRSHTKTDFEVFNDILLDRGQTIRCNRSKKYYANRARVRDTYPHAWIIVGLMKEGRK